MKSVSVSFSLPSSFSAENFRESRLNYTFNLEIFIADFSKKKLLNRKHNQEELIFIEVSAKELYSVVAKSDKSQDPEKASERERQDKIRFA